MRRLIFANVLEPGHTPVDKWLTSSDWAASAYDAHQFPHAPESTGARAARPACCCGTWARHSADFSSNVASLWIEFRAAPEDSCGADDYRILGCTPDWIKQVCRHEKVVSGRHMLIVLEYDIEEIKSAIDRSVEECNGRDFEEMANKIARFAAWEFEDYKV
jgi:hypothetical protein